MKIGIMQPYFFPYLGYWQLMNAVDRYVVYDDVNFIKGGRINRNAILVQGQAHNINLILSGASPNKHINEVAVLIFAVDALQPRGVHVVVAGLEVIVLAVGVVAVLEIELQRIVIILAEIHQRVHLLVGQGVLRNDAALPVQHAGTVAGDGVIKPDAAQLALAVHGRPGPPRAEDELAARRLHLLDGLDHRRAGKVFPKGDKGIIVIAG